MRRADVEQPYDSTLDSAICGGIGLKSIKAVCGASHGQ
jgi:hypothetical protein